jgi:hypothetical protein
MEKAGIDLKAAENKALLTIGDEIPDNIAEQIEENLLTESSAVSNRKVKSTIIAQFANGIDLEITERAKKLGLSEDKINAIVAEKGTGKKLQLLLDSTNELLLEAKEAGGKKPELKALESQVAQLNGELAKYKAEYIPKLELDKFVQEKENEILWGAINQDILQRSWSDVYPEDVRTVLVKTKLDSKIKELNAQIIRKDGVIQIIDAETGTEKFDNKNKPVKFAALVDTIMEENKFIKVSDPKKEEKQIVTSHQAVRPNSNAELLKSLIG